MSQKFKLHTNMIYGGDLNKRLVQYSVHENLIYFFSFQLPPENRTNVSGHSLWTKMSDIQMPSKPEKYVHYSDPSKLTQLSQPWIGNCPIKKTSKKAPKVF